jgi:hypothetical protein
MAFLTLVTLGLISCNTSNYVYKIIDPLNENTFYQWNGVIWIHAQIPNHTRSLKIGLRKDNNNEDYVEFDFEAVYPVDKPAFDTFAYWVYGEKIAKFKLSRLRDDILIESFVRYIDEDGLFYQQADPQRDKISAHHTMKVPVKVVLEACKQPKSQIKFYSENGRVIWSANITKYHNKPWSKLAVNSYNTLR